MLWGPMPLDSAKAPAPTIPGALGAALVASLIGALLTPLFDVDEGAFSEASREMLESGDFGFTYLNGQPRFDKPILIYWLQALSLSVFGLNEFAARLPSILSGLGVAGVASLFAARWSGNPANALFAFVLFSSSLGPLVMRHAATADALLHLLLLLSVLHLIESMRDGSAAVQVRADLRRAWAYSALAVLSKGLIGLLVPVLTVLGVCLMRRGLAPLRHALSDGVAVALWLALCLPWYVYAYLRFDADFIAGLFGKHHVERSLRALEGHTGSIAHTALMMLVLSLPFTPWILAGAWRTVRGAPRRIETQALVAWCTSLLLVFSVVATKLPHYAMYALLPLLMLAALGDGPRRGELIVGVVFGAALVLLGLFLDPILQALAQQRPEGDYYRELFDYRLQSWQALSETESSDLRVPGVARGGWFPFSAWFARGGWFALGGWLALGGWAALGLCLVVLWTLGAPGKTSARARGGFGGHWALLGLGAAMHLSLCLSTLPSVGAVLQGPTREVARASAAHTAVTYRFRAPSVAFYRRQITRDRTPETGEMAILRSSELDALAREAGPHAVFRPVERAGPVVLLRREADRSP